VVPLALAGRDVCGSAITGSGKTAAFALPCLERLLHRPRQVRMACVWACMRVWVWVWVRACACTCACMPVCSNVCLLWRVHGGGHVRAW